MKKLIIFLMFCLAMMWTQDVKAQSLATKNNPGYFEVTIPHTWVNCANDGSVFVIAKWNGGANVEYGYGDYSGPGQMVPISTLAYNGNITYLKVSVSAHDSHLNGSAPNFEEFDHYKCQHSIPPGPCQNSNGCKRYPGNVIICDGTGPENPNTDN